MSKSATVQMINKGGVTANVQRRDEAIWLAKGWKHVKPAKAEKAKPESDPA
jgi:hypothetical protein